MARWLRCVAQSTVVLSVLLSVASPTHSQDEAGDPARVIKALALASGERVAEVGAGDGALTVAIARHVGPDGRVFTTELGESRVRSLQAAVTASGLAQIEVVEAATTHTNLGDACCDALLMRDVYHHFADPAAMNVSLLASLKPGGRVAILDFAPSNGKESTTAEGRSRDGRHGVGRQTVSRELADAGFTVVSSDTISGRRFMVVARRP